VRADTQLHPRALIAAARGRFHALFDRERMDAELDDEMRFHLEMEIAKNTAAGMSSSDARRAALVAFGGVDRAVEAHRDSRGTRMIEDAIADMRFAIRSLLRAPGFVGVSIVTLAVSIAIGTALFTGVNGFVFRPLPVPDGDRLVEVFTSDYNAREPLGSTSYPDLVDFTRAAAPVADLAGQARVMYALTVDGETKLVTGSLVSSRYFRVMRVAPEIGRFPAAEHPVAPAIVVSYTLWRRSFHSDTSAVGRTIQVNGQPFTVAAVAPPEFRGTSRENADDFWMDVTFEPLVSPNYAEFERRGNRSFHLFGRLRDGGSLDALTARLSVVASRLFDEDPEDWRDSTGKPRTVTVMSERDAVLAAAQGPDLLAIAGGVMMLGLALIAIACTNLASMQLARSAARRREIATRLALGASRGRIIRQMLAECALLAVPGAATGVLLAVAASRLISRFRPIPLPSVDLSLDWRVVTFITCALLLALLVFGLMPALQTVNVDLLSDLKGEHGGAAGARIGGLRGGLIIVQVALSVLFVAASGLIALALLRDANQGRDEARRVLIARVDFLPAAGDSIHVRALANDIIARVGAIPGVVASSATEFVPVTGARRTVVAELRDEAGQSRMRELDATGIAPGYLGVVGIRLVRGRDFAAHDIGVGYRTAIMTKAMADALWPGADPIGRHFTIDHGVVAEVIGVALDPPGSGAATDHSYPGLLYLPMNLGSESEVVLHARVPSGQAAVQREIAQVLRGENTRIVAPEVITLDEYFNHVLLPQRIMAEACGVLAALQLFLAIAGLSGLVAYVTTLRRREIGIRTALGASGRSVVGLVMRQGVRLALIGGCIGLALSLGVAQVVGSTMRITAPTVVAGLGTAVGIFVLVSMTAMLFPARRALRVSPAVALRD